MNFFFGKSKETLEAMKAERERQIEKLKEEIAEIKKLLESDND